jgi:hypothetical protein
LPVGEIAALARDRVHVERVEDIDANDGSPGGRLTILYWPVESVMTVWTFSISAGLVASTVTPGKTAPDASLTTPAIDAPL